MTADLKHSVHAYAEYLDEMLPTVTADDALAADLDRQRTKRARGVWYRRPVVVFLAAMIAVLVIALLPVVLLDVRDADVVDQPTTTSTSPQPPAPTALAGLEGPIRAETSGSDTWAWEYDGDRVWRYADGRWEELPARPGDVSYVSSVVSIAGTPWALTDGGIRVLDGDTWQELDTPAAVQVWRIAADPLSETLWLSTGERLYCWTGEAMIEIGEPEIDIGGEFPDWSYVGEIAVTSDGTVWAAGFSAWAPMLGVLASYEPATDTWEAVKPWDGKPLPAGLLATTSSGGLWVLLEEWDVDESSGTSSEGSVLAYRNGDTGQWSVYDEDLPDGRPFAIAADGDGVWLAQGYAHVEGSEPMLGLYHFDGLVWTRYVDGVEVLEVAVTPDGTVWYMTDQEPYVLRPLEL